MGTRSATTHEFRRGKVNGDRSCLYASFRQVNGIFDTIDNECLQSMVTDCIHKNKALYHEDFGNGMWNDEHEIEALALIFHKLIRIVSKTKTAQGRYVTNILIYGEYVESCKECVYILYDGEKNLYEPLYMINKQNTDEKLTVFQVDDEVVSELIAKFIREELHDDGFIQLDNHNIDDEMEISIQTNDETEQLFNLLVPNAVMNFPILRQIPDYASLSLAKAIEEEP